MCKHFRSNFVFKTTFVGTAHVMEGGGRQMGVAAYEEGLGVPLFPLSWLLSLFLAWTSRIQSIATMSTTATTMTTSAVRELRLFSVDPFRNCPPRSLPPPPSKNVCSEPGHVELLLLPANSISSFVISFRSV